MQGAATHRGRYPPSVNKMHLRRVPA
ncbi:hypothetical protein BVI2075_200060 [Burkholderia vietnamiensis]|nr:hypothetical protein BVI2075_200060 [Burkholderia vietnamiensis]